MALPPDANVIYTATLSTPKAKQSAPTGNDRLVAASSIQPSMNAPDVMTLDTGPKDVLKLRRAKALTPYIPEAWERWLHTCNLIHRYPLISDGLRHGFHAGLSNLAIPFTPPNNPSVEVHADVFKDIVDKEFAKGCYIGPFNLAIISDLLSLIQTAPLSLVPKPGKFRPVQNLSHPHNPLPQNLISQLAGRPQPFPHTL